VAEDQVFIGRSGIAENAIANITKKIIESTSVEKMKTDPKKVIKIVEQMTRAEILARLGNIASDVDWYAVYLAKKDELQEYLFGTSDYTTLGGRWGILKEKSKKKKYNAEDLEL